jgi:hypothetical protein
MQNTTHLLLKHGLKYLVLENQDLFKQNITQALAIKLHESFDEIKKEICQNLLFVQKQTESSDELNEFVDFINNFKSGTYKFKNGSSINISESDVKSLKCLFESLSPKNRKQMVLEILTDGSAFKQHVSFSQKVKNLL